MKLWLISQKVNTGYDTYDSAVVAAETEEQARKTSPAICSFRDYTLEQWAIPEHVTVKYIGDADPSVAAGVVLASFNAG